MAILAAALLAEVVHTVVADHHMGVDAIALAAMVGALALGQELAGAVVGLMFSGSQAIEDLASTRARRELTALIERAPKFAQRRVADAIHADRRAVAIARQSVLAGMGLSSPRWRWPRPDISRRWPERCCRRAATWR